MCIKLSASSWHSWRTSKRSQLKLQNCVLELWDILIWVSRRSLFFPGLWFDDQRIELTKSRSTLLGTNISPLEFTVEDARWDMFVPWRVTFFQPAEWKYLEGMHHALLTKIQKLIGVNCERGRRIWQRPSPIIIKRTGLGSHRDHLNHRNSFGKHLNVKIFRNCMISVSAHTLLTCSSLPAWNILPNHCQPKSLFLTVSIDDYTLELPPPHPVCNHYSQNYYEPFLASGLPIPTTKTPSICEDDCIQGPGGGEGSSQEIDAWLPGSKVHVFMPGRIIPPGEFTRTRTWRTTVPVYGWSGAL